MGQSDLKHTVPPKWGHLQTETEEEAIIKAEEESRLFALGEAEALDVLAAVLAAKAQWPTNAKLQQHVDALLTRLA